MIDDSNIDDIALSATVILIRDQSVMETLMVQRSARMGFAAGAIVFPGGKVDRADYDPLWPTIKSADITGNPNSDESAENVTRIAAIRELFEETGVLLASRNGVSIVGAEATRLKPSFDDARRVVHHDAGVFRDFLESEDLEPDIEALTLFARWRTPPALHRRYDTWFYLANMPEGQTVEADGEESTEAIWAAPQTFLDQGAKGEHKIIYPTARNLELLATCSSYMALDENAHARRIECIEPTIIDRAGDKYLTIPDGLGYPILEEKLETAMRS